MTTMKKAFLTLIVLHAFFFVNAQGVAFVNINPDPASTALAGTGIARSADAFAMENNVAATALNAPRMSVSAGFGLWQPAAANAKLLSAQGFYRISDRLSVAMQYKGLKYPEYSVVSPDGRVKGSFSPNEMTAGLGVAYGITDCLAAGVNLRMVSSALASDAKGSAFSADIAMKYDNDGVQAGFSICNLGTKINYGDVSYSLPASAKLGAAYSINTFTLSAQADYFLKKGLGAGIGAEYVLLDIVSLRAGYHYGKTTGVLTSFASAGIGVVAYGVRLDFAYITGSANLGNTMLFSLGYTL